jgi:hypothetical protein
MRHLALKLSATVCSHTVTVRKNSTRLSHFVYNGIEDNLELLVVQLIEIVLKPSSPKLFTATAKISSQITDTSKLFFFVFI